MGRSNSEPRVPQIGPRAVRAGPRAGGPRRSGKDSRLNGICVRGAGMDPMSAGMSLTARNRSNHQERWQDSARTCSAKDEGLLGTRSGAYQQWGCQEWARGDRYGTSWESLGSCSGLRRNIFGGFVEGCVEGPGASPKHIWRLRNLGRPEGWPIRKTDPKLIISGKC